MSDQGLKTFAGISATLMNSLIFAGMAWAGMTDALPEAAPEPDAIAVELHALPRKGVKRDPKAPPRIIKAPEPPAPETDAVNLARKKAEAEEEAKKKKEEKRKRELAEERRRLEDEKQRKRAEKRRKAKARRDRQRAISEALSEFDDPRGDEDSPEGVEDGSPNGTSTSLGNAQHAYISLVSSVLQRQFEVPAVVPAEQRKRLQTHVHIRIDTRGKLKAPPAITKPSGNRFFDQAALRAAKKFDKSSELRIPLPAKGTPLYTLVMKKGITARMKGR